jgi:hypothetical protein
VTPSIFSGQHALDGSRNHVIMAAYSMDMRTLSQAWMFPVPGLPGSGELRGQPRFKAAKREN